MPTFTNTRGDTVVVTCGGFGGDNVLGTVEEKTGNITVPVKGADVTVSNSSIAGEVGDDKTNNQGKFDIDVDAACRNLILVYVRWRDSNRRRHVITGRFRCPCPDEETETACSTDSDQKLAMIDRLETNIEENLALVASRQALLNAWHDQLSVLVNNDLNALGQGDDKEEQKKAIDKRIQEEVARLENKFESARAQGGVPPSDMQWAITQEMFELLKKLVFKAFLLQGLKPPPLRPGPEG